MRLFLFEYTCATDAGASSSLRTEGWAMLAAVLEDFARVPGVRATTLLHESFPHEPAGVAVHRVRTEEEPAAFRELAAAADYTLVIAPEFDGLLEERCRWVEAAGGRLLGPSVQAVTLTADKLRLAEHLRACRVPTPVCVPLPGPAPFGFPAVAKPRHGAGSQATFLVHDPDELIRCMARARAEGWHGEMLLQPFVHGVAASVAFLVGPRQCLGLPSAAQELSGDGRFRYRGGRVPLPGPLRERAARLARQAVETVPGLRGWVGVDLVLGEGSDGDGAMEINPRLTTSYVGLRALTPDNLADAMLRVGEGTETASLRWREGTVRFTVSC